MRWMCELHPKLGFDCASEREITDVIGHGRPIIYAQPCKKSEDIRTAQDRGVSQTVVDSVEEVEKLAAARWEGSVLVRLLVDDAGSKQPFSRKFGAPLEWLPAIYDAARANRMNMTGFSFHVGSECGAPSQYAAAIAACDVGAGVARRYGFGTTCVDIGGGFVPNEKSFAAVGANVTAGRKAASSLLRDPVVQWIAEPGRFLAAPTHTLYTTIIGKKPVWPAPKHAGQPAWRLTVDESVYGAFSNIPFDGQRPVLEPLEPVRRSGGSGETRPTVVFGRTCDSGDCIGTDIMLPTDLRVGDMLRIRNMGAYTTVTASEFNGFPKARCVYEPQLR
jgi:ornithine decarboxylase